LFDRTLPGWCEETVLEELGKNPDLTVKSLCKQFALNVGWEALKKDIQQWKRVNPDFHAEYSEIMVSRGMGHKLEKYQPRKDDVDPDLAEWRQQFCEDLYESKHLLVAVERSPFSYSTINRRLNPSHGEFDQRFHDMVAEVELKMCRELEGNLFEDIDSLPPGKDRAWIGLKILERRSPKRWNPVMEMKHSGAVQHVHGHIAIGAGGSKMAELAESQALFFKENAKAIEAGDEDIIEAEVIE
jgi:hypothetical protein